MNEPITKSQIVRLLSERYTSLYAKDIKQVVDTIFDALKEALKEGRRIEIRGFGAFTTRRRKARTARNPKTNVTVDLTDRRVPYFRAGKELKERINRI